MQLYLQYYPIFMSSLSEIDIHYATPQKQKTFSQPTS